MRAPRPVPSLVAAIVAAAVATALSLLVLGRDQLPDVVMIYLLGIILVSSRHGLGASMLAALASVAAFDFFFVPPYLTFAIGDARHAVTFAVMFLVAIVISGLAERVRSQAQAQVALADERARLAEETERARREVEREQLRSALLSSVSHDLRTPLAVITGAASTLVESRRTIDEPTRHDLTQTILEEAERLDRLIRNLLDMTRLESGAIRVEKDWTALEEIVGSALARVDARLGERVVHADLPRDLPLVPFDAVLMEQVLVNLLENAAKHGRGAIDVRATPEPGRVIVEVADRGPGVPAGEERRVFEKFHRGAREGGPDGVGLGLAICRAVVTAHGGEIWVEPRAGGGASFRFTLPIEGEPPELDPGGPPGLSAPRGQP